MAKTTGILKNFACNEPHAAFSGSINGLRHGYTYFTRTIPGISHLSIQLSMSYFNYQ